MKALQNNIVKLEPINTEHIDGILNAARFPEIWEHMSVTLLDRESVVHYVEDAIHKRDAKTDYPFVIVDAQTNEIIGSTSYMDISMAHKRLEIGSTWLTPANWRSNINTNCKFLLLQYGFEELRFNRIQIKTGHENVRSQKAIERLGAVKEGILRNHMIQKEGTIRHTVMYSITSEEWPEMKKRFMEEFLCRN
ncbi:GNAT family N-acetyltransferase [Solibacillus sp. R5-41]|uniref:GNAT family N-acetyltransferase n=1 Tax=Solibacillus sp. R5-41 TaxID=2048654 RepID=UPI000C12479C|nr:GNAT family protein [Solibacillus sp. R5-41]ATP39960.1 GNAT family N-acetyltransferase [Solibacillus sp. R5-41]